MANGVFDSLQLNVVKKKEEAENLQRMHLHRTDKAIFCFLLAASTSIKTKQYEAIYAWT